MPRHRPVAAPPCVWCGEPGWHGTTDGCLAALKEGMAAEQVRLVTEIATVQRLRQLQHAVTPPTIEVCPTCGAWHPVVPGRPGRPWTDRSKT